MDRYDVWLASRDQAEQLADESDTFWLPCPWCGIPFGGFEWRWGHKVPTSDTGFAGICPPCAYEWGEAYDVVCAAHGHDVMQAVDPGTRLPVAAWCERCLVEFDPQSDESLGRPLFAAVPHRGAALSLEWAS